MFNFVKGSKCLLFLNKKIQFLLSMSDEQLQKVDAKEMLLEKEDQVKGNKDARKHQDDEVINSTAVPETMIEFDNAMPHQGIDNIIENHYVDTGKGEYITTKQDDNNQGVLSSNQAFAIRETEVAGQYGSNCARPVTDSNEHHNGLGKMLMQNIIKSYKVVLSIISLVCISLAIILNSDNPSSIVKFFKTAFLYGSLLSIIVLHIILLKDVILQTMVEDRHKKLEDDAKI